ncbi:hypothetical protein, partial [Thermogutta sp.]|uniref:hypothetical protein n=1 Tax=Thermogutta sp. TaxID=1962930 RepID=UPI0025FF834B
MASNIRSPITFLKTKLFLQTKHLNMTVLPSGANILVVRLQLLDHFLLIESLIDCMIRDEYDIRPEAQDRRDS